MPAAVSVKQANRNGENRREEHGVGRHVRRREKRAYSRQYSVRPISTPLYNWFLMTSEAGIAISQGQPP